MTDQLLQDLLTPERTLPIDASDACLIGRAWYEGLGPCVVTCRDGQLLDLTERFPTLTDVLRETDPAAAVRAAEGKAIASLADALANSPTGNGTRLLAPADLQPVKATGVTFVTSLLERVIEEQTQGDPARAEQARTQIMATIGGDIRSLVPGSAEAAALKEVLSARGAWSQYLEVGLGRDAELFTKAPPMASVGTGAEVGVRSGSRWNNPEPEVVLAVGPDAHIKGACVGNDVNLRDYEGRSALLLGKAKDNNASCALGPFIRLSDKNFTLNDIRQAVVAVSVVGEDGFVLDDHSSMAEISRDIEDLIAQSMGETHDYPDGMMFFCGTMFAPIKDRDAAGAGFTHKIGDVVTVSSERLGMIANRVNTAEKAGRWRYGLRDLMADLSARGALG
ncbi:MAG: fumarylacetoacetate hydrolase family protein [Geminicoccaceae bacterium]